MCGGADLIQPPSDVMDTFNEVTEMALYIFNSDCWKKERDAEM